MTCEHESWDSQMASHIDDIHCEVTGDIQFAIGGITQSLQRYGFALLSGLGRAVERSVTADELVELAANLGTLVPQSPRGEEVEDVRDFSDIEARDDRGYRSRGELAPHSDPPTLIVLHCLQAAKSGGETYLINVRSIHDRIARLAPDLLAELYKGYPHWCVEGQQGILQAGPAAEPRAIFAERDGRVSCVHYRPFTEMAAKMRGEPLTGEQLAALDLFDECASSPELALRFQLRPGQTLLLHNRTVLHARTDYEDWPEPERRRHLLRVWIDAAQLLPVSPEHELGNLFAPTA